LICAIRGGDRFLQSREDALRVEKYFHPIINDSACSFIHRQISTR
jgi:hypothetical protein